MAGNNAYRIDPLKDDLYRWLIDLRSAVKVRMKATCGAEKDALDAEQQALKILANATSYGIFVELIVEDLDKKETRLCLGSGNDGFPVEVEIAEAPGRYFHPLLATLITGAARLMLAMTERLLVDAGLDWVFCDTDSMAIAAKEDGPRHVLRQGPIRGKLVRATQPLRNQRSPAENRRRQLRDRFEGASFALLSGDFLEALRAVQSRRETADYHSQGVGAWTRSSRGTLWFGRSAAEYPGSRRATV
jgi:hypothetical protein